MRLNSGLDRLVGKTSPYGEKVSYIFSDFLHLFT